MHPSEAMRENDKKALLDVKLSPAQVEKMLFICSELLSLCATVTGKIDPAVGRLLEYVREEVSGVQNINN